MQGWLSARLFARPGDVEIARPETRVTPPRADRLAWEALSWPAQFYVAIVMVAGASTLVAFFPTTFPQPVLFARVDRSRVSHLALEGQPADCHRERFDALGLVRRRSDGAAAARTATGDHHCGCRRL